jgi:hypothetical protein
MFRGFLSVTALTAEASLPQASVLGCTCGSIRAENRRKEVFDTIGPPPFEVGQERFSQAGFTRLLFSRLLRKFCSNVLFILTNEKTRRKDNSAVSNGGFVKWMIG